MNSIEIAKEILKLQEQINALRTIQMGWQPVFLQTPLTSTSWDGDSFSTTTKTKIDLSAVFGVPAGVKGVFVRLLAWDSGSAGSANAAIGLSPNDTGASIALNCWLAGNTNSKRTDVSGIVPCNSDGDIYYQAWASGAGTLTVYLQVWGYWI